MARLKLTGKTVSKTAQVDKVTCVADASDSLDGTYFLIYDSAGSVGVWIDVDNSGTTIPAGASAADRALEITGIVTDDTAADVATAIAAIINADSQFSASADGDDVVITQATAGVVSNAAEGDTGFTFATPVEGADTWTLPGAVGKYSITAVTADCTVNGATLAAGSTLELSGTGLDRVYADIKVTTGTATVWYHEPDPL